MQRSVNNLVGYSISATDGELGKVSEFYFDDHTWSIRYLVVETGNWLSDRKVLIPHAALGITDWKLETFKVNLSMEQVRNSPDIETDKPVARQHEIQLMDHYGLPAYWLDGFYNDPIRMLPLLPIIERKTEKEEEDSARKLHNNPHLRSTKNIEGYHIHANDGDIGHVEDYIIDDEKWNVCFLIIDTHNWLPGRKVLILPRWITGINWDELKVFVNLSRAAIKNSPEFDPTYPLDDHYEKKLLNHYNEYENLID